MGAKSPDCGILAGVFAGVLGRAVKAGVFGRTPEGVFERVAAAGGRADALDDGLGGANLMFLRLDDPRSDGGVEADDGLLGKPWYDVGGDLAGVRAVFDAAVAAVAGRPAAGLALEGVAGGRMAEPVLDCRTGAGFLACSGVPASAGAGSAGSGPAWGSRGGDVGVSVGRGVSAVSADVPSMGDAGPRRSAASGFGDASGVGRAGLGEGSSSLTASGGGGDETVFNSFSSLPVLTGGQTRFSFTSSLSASPAMWETGVDTRGGTEVSDCRLVCCSNRPMRFATLARGLSSGNGLQITVGCVKRRRSRDHVHVF